MLINLGLVMKLIFTKRREVILLLVVVFTISITSCSTESDPILSDEIMDISKATTSDGRQLLEFPTFGGIDKSMNLWAIGWRGNTQQNINRVGGPNQVDILRVGCPKEWALVNDRDLGPDAIAEMDKQLAKADKVPNSRIGCVCSGGNGINSYFVRSKGFRENRWINLFRAMKRHIESKGKTVAFIEVGNEQDFGGKKGSPNNINNIQSKMQSDSDFTNIPLVGPSPLSAGNANREYNQMKNTLDWGATHAINGSGDKYIDFVKKVRNDGKPYWGSEIHNLVEMIIAAEYDGLGGLWWSPVRVNQGLFQQYQQRGNRLGYTEVRSTFSAGAAYRDNTQNNTIHVFLASKNGEKFRLRTTNRRVRFNDGPLSRTFDVDVAKNEDAYIKITW